MLKNRQSTRPKQSTVPMPPPHSYTVMQFKSTQNEDDDDICPVCESECTCGNTNTAQYTPPQPSTSTAAPTPVPLTIKLPARKALNPAPKQTTPKRVRPQSTKPKQTTAGSVTADGSSSSSHYVLVNRPPPFSALGHQLGAPPPVPVASTSSLSFRDTSPLTPEPELEPPSKSRAKPKQSTKAAAPKNRKKSTTIKPKPKPRPVATLKKNPAGVRSKKNKDATWTSSSARRKGKGPVLTSSDESMRNITEDEGTYVTRMALDSDGAESVHFPTFISAISTTSGNDDSASMTSDSFDSDSSIRAEEENMILVEQRAKVRREILNGEESWHMEKRKWDHLKNNNNWEIHPRKRSVGAEEADDGTESESDSEIGAEEEEEEEADDDDDDDDDEADVTYGRGMVTGWQSDNDDFDAELFFATLTDSSGPGSDADAEDGEESGDDDSDDNSDLSAISMTEAAAAGLFSSPFGAGCPLVVTEDWDGRLVFANGLKDGQGVLDVHFEVDAAQRHRTIREAMEVDVDETEENLEEGEDDDDDVISDDGGETTDDMLDHRPGIGTPQGVVPLPFRCPTPPVTYIDPLSTLSPITGGGRRNKLLRGALPADSPRPADILAGAGKIFWDSGPSLDKASNGVPSGPASLAATSPPDTATSSSQSRQMPSMGSFEQVSADPKRRAIIDGKKTVVFSPFTRVRRARKLPSRGRKRTAAGNDIFPYLVKRPRQSSLPDSSRAWRPVDTEEDADPLVQSSPELPVPAAPIGLDDVLDASFLDSDDSGEPAMNTSGERHLRNLTRWDRIPMGTFRRSRAPHMDENNVRVSGPAPPNDGVSYGSAGGRVLRKSPLGAALWQTNTGRDRMSRPPGSVAVSPVIFPMRDGERTPTADQFPDSLQKPLLGDSGSSKSRKQKRREKKKRGGPAHVSPTPLSIPASNGFYHPPPNVPHLKL